MRNYLVLLCLIFLNSGCGYIFISARFKNPLNHYVETQKINHIKGNLYQGDTIALLKPYVNTYYEVAKDSFVYQEENTTNATFHMQYDIIKRLKRHWEYKIINIPLEYDDLVKEVYQMFDSLRRAKVKRYVFSDTSVVAKLHHLRKDYKISGDCLLLSCLWWSNMWGRYYDDQVYLTMSPIIKHMPPRCSTVIEQHTVIISFSKREVIFYKRLYGDTTTRFFPNGYDLTLIEDNNLVTFFSLKNSLKKRKKR